MENGSSQRRAFFIAGLVTLALLAGLPATAQVQTKPKCNTYKLDHETNRIIFNDPRVIIMMPSKEQRLQLRAQGTPGQVFLMKNCDAPDVMAEVKVYSSPDGENDTTEKIPSATRVIILEERGDWVKAKGYTSLWKGTGWIKTGDKILVVKF